MIGHCGNISTLSIDFGPRIAYAVKNNSNFLLHLALELLIINPPVIDSLEGQISRDEGGQSKDGRFYPYTDTTGHVTIGYGRNLTADGISLAEAVVLRDNDITKAHLDLLRALPWAISLDEARSGVLLNMTFNLGIAKLLEFATFLNLVHAGEYDAAASDMLGTLWAKQVGPRAARLAEQIRTGAWQ